MKVGKWKYRADQAAPSYPADGTTSDGYVGWIEIPKQRSYIDADVIGEDREVETWTPAQLAEKSGAPLVMVQTIMRSMRYAIDELRALATTATRNL